MVNVDMKCWQLKAPEFLHESNFTFLFCLLCHIWNTFWYLIITTSVLWKYFTLILVASWVNASKAKINLRPESDLTLSPPFCFVDPHTASPARCTSTPPVPSSPPSQRQFPGRPQPLRGNTGRSKFHIPSREGQYQTYICSYCYMAELNIHRGTFTGLCYTDLYYFLCKILCMLQEQTVKQASLKDFSLYWKLHCWISKNCDS